MTRYWAASSAAAFVMLSLTSCTTIADARPTGSLIDQSDVEVFASQFRRDTKRCGRCFNAQDYFASAGHGLSHFRKTERVLDADNFEELVVAEWDFYEAFLAERLDYASLEPRVEIVYDHFARIYPNEDRPTIYFTVGQTYSGGTASERGIIVAAETFGIAPRSTSYGRPVIDRSLLVPLIAHELVHYHQRVPVAEELRLIDILTEGSADFIAELLVGPVVRTINSPDLYEYGFAEMDAISSQFAADVADGDLSDWLYSNDTPFRRDIGYFAGYCIARLYVERSNDPVLAIRDLIELKHPDRILRQSGFLSGRRCAKDAAALSNAFSIDHVRAL